MPKLHFEIVDGYKIEDPVGLECKNEEQAKSVAQDIARQIAIDLVGTRSRTIVVIDDDRRSPQPSPNRPDRDGTRPGRCRRRYFYKLWSCTVGEFYRHYRRDQRARATSD